MTDDPFAGVELLGLDIDGTLTDGKLLWGGDAVGWTQRYSVRDGESILRARRAGLAVVPISRNRTACARARMEHLGLVTEWVGVADKEAALAEVLARHGVDAARVCYVGDSVDDIPILAKVGLGCAVADGHPSALAVARYVTRAAGGENAVEEVVDRLLAAREGRR